MWSYVYIYVCIYIYDYHLIVLLTMHLSSKLFFGITGTEVWAPKGLIRLPSGCILSVVASRPLDYLWESPKHLVGLIPTLAVCYGTRTLARCRPLGVGTKKPCCPNNSFEKFFHNYFSYFYGACSRAGILRTIKRSLFQLQLLSLATS